MNKCIKCGVAQNENQEFCHVCGQNQFEKPPQSAALPTGSSTFLTILCVFTIIGSLFGMARGFLYEIVAAAADNETYIRGWIYGFTNLGTLIGAILMLQKSKTGLYVYSVAQGIYIITVLFATLVYTGNELFAGAEEMAFIISVGFLIPSILFPILYWLDVNKKHLR